MISTTRAVRVLFFTASLAILPHAADASVAIALPLEELTARADRILVGEIVSVQSSWNAGRTRIFSTIEVQVAELWKGAAPAANRIVIVQPGGVVGDLEMKVHGMPIFTVGERSVLFLRGRGDPWQVVGMAQGRRPLRFDVTNRRWMADPAGLAGLVTIEPAGKDRTPVPALPLEEIRRRVRVLVKP